MGAIIIDPNCSMPVFLNFAYVGGHKRKFLSIYFNYINQALIRSVWKISNCKLLISQLAYKHLLLCRLSTEIAVAEETTQEVSKFREGHTQVNDVKKVYLTGSYKLKYKNVTANMAKTGIIIEPNKHRVYPSLEIGHRKVKSAYPNVRLKFTPTNTPFHENTIVTPSRAMSTLPGNQTPFK